METAPLLAGFAFGASLIIAIGAQNAHVLRHGILKLHVFTVCALCVAVDWTLIAIGAAGFGALVARIPLLTNIAAWGGAAFLAVYGALALRSALHPDVLHAEKTQRAAGASWWSVVTLTLAVSLLNPHVYLDTVVLLGSIAAQYPDGQRSLFAWGAGIASLVWFFGLGYGARVLAPLFERPVAWRVLDSAIVVIMWSIAARLVWSQLAG